MSASMKILLSIINPQLQNLRIKYYGTFCIEYFFYTFVPPSSAGFCDPLSIQIVFVILALDI